MKKIILFILILLCFISHLEAASTYYASNAGTGTTCSSGSPCTPNYAVNTKAAAGDTIVLKNGTYTTATYMLEVTTSGTAGNPKTIQAETEGLAIFDGTGTIEADGIYIHGADAGHHVSYIDITGVQIKGFKGNAAYNTEAFMVYFADHINVYKVSSHGHVHTGSHGVNAFQSYYSDHVLFEDCFAYSNFRVGIDILLSDHVTVRRAYIEPYKADTSNTGEIGIQYYESSYVIVENSIVDGQYVYNTDNGSQGIAYQDYVYAAGVTSNNSLYGSVARNNKSQYGLLIRSEGNNITNNDVTSFVSLKNDYSVFVSGSAASDITSLVVVGGLHDDLNGCKGAVCVSDTYCAYRAAHGLSACSGYGYVTDVTLTNSIMLHTASGASKGLLKEAPQGKSVTFTHSNNAIYGYGTPYDGTSGGSGEDIATEPVYLTATYGDGAYLLHPSTFATWGAEILYEYTDGSLGAGHLWPWPMESRICAETGHSVTYENYGGCTGGIWKTISSLYSADVTPPVRSAGSPSTTLTFGTTSTTMSLTTDENATCKYGTVAATAYASIANTFSSTGTTSHSQSLTGLTDGSSTAYYVRCMDAVSNANTTDYTITVAVAANPVSQADFETGTSPWVFYTDTSGTFTNAGTGYASAHAGTLTSTTAGTNVQVYHYDIPLDPYVPYVLALEVKSSTGHNMDIALIKHTTPFTNYGIAAYDYDVTTSWVPMELYFTTTGFAAPVTDGRLTFIVNPYDANGDIWYFDDIRFYKNIKPHVRTLMQNSNN